MRKRFFWLLCLAAALALCMLCADALADEPTWTYSKDTHTLTLTGGDFDKDHRWVKESSWSYIGRLVAEPGVRFVGDCRSLFSGLYDCAEMDLHNVDTSQMTSAINLFSGAGSALTKLNIEGWDTSAVTNMFSMFGSCSNLKTLDLSGWDVSHVTDMRSMFSGCKRLVTLNLTGWDLSAVTQMSYMFSECVSLTGLDVSQWNLASAQNLDSLFYQCASLTALDVENWNTAAVTDADSLFYGCKGLTSLNVSKWNTAAVRSTCLMFAGCEGLTELDLSGWNTFDLYPGGAQGMFHDKNMKPVSFDGMSAGAIKKWVESGDVLFKEDELIDLKAKTPLEIRQLGVRLSFVPEDRLGMGLVGSMGITDNMMLRSYRKGRAGFLDRKKPKELAEEIIHDLEVSTPGVNSPVRRLSGGNVQKVLVGREIAFTPKVLMAAYPVRGLDINSSYTIYNLLNKQKESGVAVIFVGEDLDVLLELCDRILVINSGAVTGIVDARTATKEEIGLMMTKTDRARKEDA